MKVFFFDTGWLDDQGRLQVLLERVDKKGNLSFVEFVRFETIHVAIQVPVSH